MTKKKTGTTETKKTPEKKPETKKPEPKKQENKTPAEKKAEKKAQPEPEKEVTVRESKVQEPIEFDLTEKDFAEKGKALSSLYADLGKAQVEEARAKKAHKLKIEQLEAEIALIAECMESGVETRMTECTKRMDYNTLLVEFVSADGEVLKERVMEHHERQLNAFDKKPGETAAVPNVPAAPVASETEKPSESESGPSFAEAETASESQEVEETEEESQDQEEEQEEEEERSHIDIHAMKNGNSENES